MSATDALECLIETRLVAAGWLAPRDRADLLGTLVAFVRDARAAWPALAVADDAFAAHVVDALARAGPGTRLAALRGPDLLLAFAAGRGDAEAVRILNDRFIDRLDGPLARVVGAQGLVDDVKQILRQQLLMAPDGRANKLSSYGGRGDLYAWLRVIAVRLALESRRREERVPRPVARPLEDAWAEGDPETEHLRRRYRPLLKQAIADALAGLDTRDRLLLEQHHVDGRTIDDLARIYRVHRATAARWLERARDQIRCATRQALGRKIGLEGSACDSLMGHLVEDLTLTLWATRR